MEAKGCLELFRSRRRLDYPNLVVLCEGKPMEIAVISVRYPFVGSIDSSFREQIASSMCPDLDQRKIFVQFRNSMDGNRPWDLFRGASMTCTVREERMDIEYKAAEVNENESEA